MSCSIVFTCAPLSPRLCGPCWWSQKPAGWTWTCWGSHCAWSCQWPECICNYNRIKATLHAVVLSWLNNMRKCVCWENGKDDLTWLFLPLSVCIDPWTDFWRCCSLSMKEKIQFIVNRLHYMVIAPVLVQILKLNSRLSFLPFPVFRMLQHSGGSPVERCHCSGEQVQSEHLSVRH